MPDTPIITSYTTVFTQLGWIALAGRAGRLERLVFGHRTSRAAVAALEKRLLQDARRENWCEPLRRRLQRYAQGQPIDFGDVPVELLGRSGFYCRVIHVCRQIPPGSVLTYGQLAARAGSPGAARAVGRCMAGNPIPLIVPCHRVIGADGRLGGYSAPGGIRMKRRLLQLEGIRLPTG